MSPLIPPAALASIVPATVLPAALTILRLFGERPTRLYVPAPSYTDAAAAMVRAGVLQSTPEGYKLAETTEVIL